MNILRKTMRALVAGAMLLVAGQSAQALRIRDAVRMKNEVPNELMGMGLIIGLTGTGDGGDYAGAIRPLKEMMRNFDDPIQLDKELKNANNVAIVMLSVQIPTLGAHSGEKLDVKVSAIGASKSLKSGQLPQVPLYAPGPNGKKIVLGWASGALQIPDEKHPTQAIIRGGGVLIEDILPEEMKDNTFIFVIHPEMASQELASAIADQINEDVAPQTGGKSIAIALDANSVQVTIPQVERANPVPFISRLRTLPLPTLPDPAIVVVDEKSKTIVCSEEVEIAPTLVSQGNMTITIGQPPSKTGNFLAIDPKGGGNAKLRDLQAAFNQLKVSPEERIEIIRKLNDAHALKAELKDKKD
jgi:flagellar P-ring protein precursor FlgI